MDTIKYYMKHCKAKKTYVVARLQLKSGATYYGVNVESSCHGLSICAERAAIVVGISIQGPKDFIVSKLDVFAEKNGVPLDIVPCGACRQLLAEYSDEDSDICGKPMNYWMPNPYI